MERIWFTSDTHLGHVNIIDYCKRPFLKTIHDCALCAGTGVRRPHSRSTATIPCTHPDVEAMDRTIIERWNATVAPEDTVWHLGDFAFGSAERARTYFKRLNGRKTLVIGNHDRHRARVYEEMGFLVQRGPCRLGHLYLSHRPPWPVEAGRVYLCGHIHNLWREKTHSLQMRAPARVFNVGVDVRGFRPIQLSDLGLREGLAL